MNWAAGVLVLLGITVVVIGVAGSQKSVCQALTGGDCTWLPGSTSQSTSSSGGSSPTPSSNTSSSTSYQQVITPMQSGQINSHIVGL